MKQKGSPASGSRWLCPRIYGEGVFLALPGGGFEYFFACTAGLLKKVSLLEASFGSPHFVPPLKTFGTSENTVLHAWAWYRKPYSRV